MSLQILLVEDDPATGDALSRLLGLDGHGVAWARTGSEALLVLDVARRGATASPDAMVLDLMLPDMNGFDLVREMPAVAAGMPIVIVSAAATLDLELAGHLPGVVEIMRKPCSADALLASLRRIEAGMDSAEVG